MSLLSHTLQEITLYWHFGQNFWIRGRTLLRRDFRPTLHWERWWQRFYFCMIKQFLPICYGGSPFHSWEIVVKCSFSCSPSWIVILLLLLSVLLPWPMQYCHDLCHAALLVLCDGVETLGLCSQIIVSSVIDVSFRFVRHFGKQL